MDFPISTFFKILSIMQLVRWLAIVTIEIINNTRGDIKGKIWERSDWGANPNPGCSLIHDVPGKKVVLDEFFCFLKCFSL